MRYSYILLSKAQEEYESSLYWYLENSLNAAEGFIDAVDQALYLICDTPQMWRNDYNHFRELGLKKYPYSIIYSIDDAKKQVVITGFRHHKRDPQKKYL